MSRRSHFDFRGRFFTFEISSLWQEISREALADPLKFKVFAFYLGHFTGELTLSFKYLDGGSHV